jgi:hypothetical protein
VRVTTPPEPLLFGECRCGSPCTAVVCAAYLEDIRESVRMRFELAARGSVMVSGDDEGRVVHRGRAGALGPLRFVTRGLWARHVGRLQPGQGERAREP